MANRPLHEAEFRLLEKLSRMQPFDWYAAYANGLSKPLVNGLARRGFVLTLLDGEDVFIRATQKGLRKLYADQAARHGEAARKARAARGES